MIHDSVINDLGLGGKGFSVNVKTTQSRIEHKSLRVNSAHNQYSPMVRVEPVILQIVKWKQEARQPITSTEGLQLANSLVDGKPIQEEVIHRQSKWKKNPTGMVSTTYWLTFMRRHKQQLQSAQGYHMASNRTEWVTYKNILIMYDFVYEQMIAAGIAIPLPPSEQYWINEDGNKVDFGVRDSSH